MNKEQEYLIIDAIYRLHDDFFHVEDAIERYAGISFQITKARSNGFFAALVSGTLAVVPILISILDVGWDSSPAIAIYCISALLLVFIGYQANSARVSFNEIENAINLEKRIPLELRMDYNLELVAAWVSRYKIVKETISELQKTLIEETDEEEKEEIKNKIERYGEIRGQVKDRVINILKTSNELLKKGKISQDEYNELIDWAKPCTDDWK